MAKKYKSIKVPLHIYKAFRNEAKVRGVFIVKVVEDALNTYFLRRMGAVK
jgi:hypothetical protein